MMTRYNRDSECFVAGGRATQRKSDRAEKFDGVHEPLRAYELLKDTLTNDTTGPGVLDNPSMACIVQFAESLG